MDRVEAIQEIARVTANRVCSILGVSGVPLIFVEGESNALAYYRVMEDKVYININNVLLALGDCSYDELKESVEFIVAHEYRHVYQYRNCSISDIEMDKYINEYDDRLIEIDANRFAQFYIYGPAEWCKQTNEYLLTPLFIFDSEVTRYYSESSAVAV